MRRLAEAKSGKMPAFICGARDCVGFEHGFTKAGVAVAESVQEASQFAIFVSGPVLHSPVPKFGSTESIHLTDPQ